MIRRSAAGLLTASAAAVLIAACGGGPNGPGPVAPPPPPPPPNQPPRVESITVARERLEVAEEVEVEATVTDAETPLEQLRFDWQADGGTFTGEGRAVRWRAPSDRPTPQEYTLRLRVTEVYGTVDASGVRPQHVVTGNSPPVLVHHSIREVTDLALSFLRDFSNSSVPPEQCVREFSNTCAGKAAELDDLRDNRRYYEVVDARYSVRRVELNGTRTRATVDAPCEFWSRFKACPRLSPSEWTTEAVPGPHCKVGAVEHVRGECRITAVYEQRRWWLCDSTFSGELLPSMRRFFGQ